MGNERITIDFDEYVKLIEAYLTAALEKGGVENWEGYQEAMNIYYGDN